MLARYGMEPGQYDNFMTLMGNFSSGFTDEGATETLLFRIDTERVASA